MTKSKHKNITFWCITVCWHHSVSKSKHHNKKSQCDEILTISISKNVRVILYCITNSSQYVIIKTQEHYIIKYHSGLTALCVKIKTKHLNKEPQCSCNIAIASQIHPSMSKSKHKNITFWCITVCTDITACQNQNKTSQ